MTTQIAATATPNDKRQAVSRAVDLLRAGEVVALPTETVYGLAADALSAEAVVKIFETKKRPRFDPLIVHLPELAWIERLAVIEEKARPLVERLMARFWPGPLTIVLPRRELVPSIVTAGLETVALRMSAHPLFSEVVRAFGRPLAAPSANRFGRISPTAAAHVMEELSGRIPLIVDGGATEHGIESTVIAIRLGGIEVLRAGPITREEVAKFAEIRVRDAVRTESPGQLPSHYRPQTPLLIAEDISQVAAPKGKRYGALLWSATPFSETFVESRRLSTTGNLREAAANLFRQLRELDRARLDCIVAEALPEEGLGVAIMDRLRRAAHR
ncbi:MAG: L-threonylcarbamoyladenylate synthase [Verrucomicrobiota bacterium]|nr:L-threonylcarbamoyladenylate synthase [Verrucomicrobiota bacterium]